jgi:hypothetical protein
MATWQGARSRLRTLEKAPENAGGALVLVSIGIRKMLAQVRAELARQDEQAQQALAEGRKFIRFRIGTRAAARAGPRWAVP